MRRRLLWWNKVEVGNLTNQIKLVEASIQDLQIKEDIQGNLSDADMNALWLYLARHHSLLQNQEVLWRQKSKAQWLKEGDRNTRFFHHATVIRRHTNTIRAIYSDHDGWIEDEADIRR